MPKMSWFVKTFKVKARDRDRDHRLMSFRIGDEKLLGKYKVFWTKIEDLKNFKLNTLLAYDDRHIKTKVRTYRNKFYTNFRGLNVPEAEIGWQSFTVISFDFLLVYNVLNNELYNDLMYYLQVYLDNCAYKIDRLSWWKSS